MTRKSLQERLAYFINTNINTHYISSDDCRVVMRSGVNYSNRVYKNYCCRFVTWRFKCVLFVTIITKIMKSLSKISSELLNRKISNSLTIICIKFKIYCRRFYFFYQVYPLFWQSVKNQKRNVNVCHYGKKYNLQIWIKQYSFYFYVSIINHFYFTLVDPRRTYRI